MAGIAEAIIALVSTAAKSSLKFFFFIFPLPFLSDFIVCVVFLRKFSSRFAFLYRLYAAFLRNVCGKNIFFRKSPCFLDGCAGFSIFSEVDARWNCNPFRRCAVAAQSIKYFFASVIRCIAQTAALSWALSRFVPVLCVRCLAPQAQVPASGFCIWITSIRIRPHL